MPAGNPEMKPEKKNKFWDIIYIYAFLGVLLFKFFVLLYRYDLLSSQSNDAKEINFRRFYKKPVVYSLTLDDIHISVKTSKLYEATRLPIILKTWFQLAKNQTWFFTDSENSALFKQTNGHIKQTNCPKKHSKKGLNCKMGAEFKFYYKSGKKWFCHFDDDNYVNVPRLVRVLREYSHNESWYLGKASKKYYYWRYPFWFATGGAGFCISQSLAMKIYPLVKDFDKYCYTMALPDDVCVGFIILWVTRKSSSGVKLTEISEFHSHLEDMSHISARNIPKQISFGYSPKKILNIPGFNVSYDPTRFLSLHCILFPYFEYCKSL